MGQNVYRANLSAKSFPFNSKNWGRTVIIQGYDNTFSRQLVSPEDPDKDVGIPQAYFMQNVVPHANGFQSVGYEKVVEGSSLVTGPRKVIPIRTAGYPTTYLLLTGLSVYLLVSGVWVQQLSGNSFTELTHAYVGGKTYIFRSSETSPANNKCWTYDPSIGAFEEITLTGLAHNVVRGIASAHGYMLAWTRVGLGDTLEVHTTNGSVVVSVPPETWSTPGWAGRLLFSANFASGSASIISGIYVASDPAFGGGPAVQFTLSEAATATVTEVMPLDSLNNSVLAWSSIDTPTDFTPSLTTGAGGGSVELAQGEIIQCLQTPVGFNIYTTENAVAAIFTGDPRFPFEFRPITSSAGLKDPEAVVSGGERDTHLMWGTSGLQAVSSSNAAVIYPEVTDFLSEGVIENYDSFSEEFQYINISGTMGKAVSVIADRYIVISYGIPANTAGFDFEYSHALVYDLGLKRWGKIAFPHRQVFEYILPADQITEVPRQSVGILDSYNSLWVLDLSGRTNADGTLLLGKYQLSRSRMLQLDEIAVETIENPIPYAIASCRLITTIDGKNNYLEQALTPVSTTGGLNIYGVRATGLNHSIMFRGNFTITSLVLTFNVHGRR